MTYKWSTAQGNRLNAEVFVPSEIDLMIMSITFGTKLPVGYFLIDLLAIYDCCLIYAYFQRHLMNALFIINHSKFYPVRISAYTVWVSFDYSFSLSGSKCHCWAIALVTEELPQTNLDLWDNRRECNLPEKPSPMHFFAVYFFFPGTCFLSPSFFQSYWLTHAK